MLVSAKLADVATPDTDAVTLYPPAVWPAVAVTLAWPFAPVVAVVAPSVARAPDVGAAKVTVAFGTGWLAASRTTTTSGAPKAAPTVADCPLPLTTAIEAGAP